jgi:hypothetical protein
MSIKEIFSWIEVSKSHNGCILNILHNFSQFSLSAETSHIQLVYYFSQKSCSWESEAMSWDLSLGHHHSTTESLDIVYWDSKQQSQAQSDWCKISTDRVSISSNHPSIWNLVKQKW